MCLKRGVCMNAAAIILCGVLAGCPTAVCTETHGGQYCLLLVGLCRNCASKEE